MAGSTRGRPRELTIDRAALRANYAEALHHAAGRALIAVVKADAYGHGAAVVSRSLAEAGCQRFAVVPLSEAAELRGAGIDARILLLGGVHTAEEAGEVAALSLSPVVHAPADLTLLARAAQRLEAPLPVQVEVDTGMSRMGVPLDSALALLGQVSAAPELAWKAPSPTWRGQTSRISRRAWSSSAASAMCCARRGVPASRLARCTSRTRRGCWSASRCAARCRKRWRCGQA